MKENKPNKKIIIIIVAIIIVLLLLLLIIFKSIQKKTYSVESFTNVLEKNNYTVEDKSSTYVDDKDIDSYIQSKDEKKNYQVDFYSMSSDNSAKKYYEKLVSQIENETNGKKGELTSNKIDYYKYVISSSGNYLVIIRNKNTVIYINTSNSYKEEVNNLLKSLGY